MTPPIPPAPPAFPSSHPDALTPLLLALWRQGNVPVQRLLTLTGWSPAQLDAALHHLSTHGCLLEQAPPSSHASGVELLRVGLPWWRDLLEARAKQTGRLLGRRTLVYQQTTSTNDVAMELATTGTNPPSEKQPIVVLADVQRSGRGRRGDPWQARAGQSVLLSILLPATASPPSPPSPPIPSTEALTLRAGLACAEAIESLLQQETEIKWPNDILLSGRKLAGILIEQRTLDPSPPPAKATVIGIGLNVAQTTGDFPPELQARATSLYLARAQNQNAPLPDRLLVIETLLEHLETHCLNFDPTDQTWLNRWKERCHLLGRELTVRQGTRTLRGHVLDVDPLHGLVLRDQTGATHFLPASTTTLSPPP